MSKLYFASDYMEVCHPSILKKLEEINFDKNVGYGTDEYCDSAKDKIRKAINNPEADVYFTVGGTQTNAIVLEMLLKPYEGVIACDTGHIESHEAGAIESIGHKILKITNKDGKLTACDLQAWFDRYNQDGNRDHTVPAGAVYISEPTESGTVYSKEELEKLYKVCQENKVYLYIDGARLGYCLAACKDLTLEDVANNCDAFYIGGTKCGAMFGEGVVFKNKEIAPHFFTQIKRRGALLAKGWLLGVQFDNLFTDDLYVKICEEGIKAANKLEAGLKEKGYKIYYNSPTNQKFILVSDKKLDEIKEKVGYTFWEKVDNENTVIRLVTSWATTEKQIDDLLELL